MARDHVAGPRNNLDRAAVSRWRASDGQPIACREKLKVLDENLEELRSLYQDALDDAVALGCDTESFRAVVTDMVARLETSLRGRKG